MFIGVLGAVWLETAFLSGAPVPAPRAQIEVKKPIHYLAEKPGSFAVLDIPIRFEPDVLQRYALNQVFHKRAIPYNVIEVKQYPFAASLLRGSLAVNLLALAGDPDFDPALPSKFRDQMRFAEPARELAECLAGAGACDENAIGELKRDLDRLNVMGITHFVLHADLLPGKSPLPKICLALFGPPTINEEGISVYILPPLE